jgi:hypothetical protein
MSPQAPAIKKFTREYRRELFVLGQDCLWSYCTAILGMPDLTDDLHWDLCQWGQGRDPYKPWTRGLLSMFRGSLKSSIMNEGYVSHCSIYYPVLHGFDHSTKLIEQKADNAFRNHFYPIQYLFQYSSRADFLFWLYGDYGPDKDMRRIPEGFVGWNTDQIDFIRSDAFSLPSITYGGLTSAFEGWHGNLVVGDDLEGADSDKSEVPSSEAWHFVTKVATPLLQRPDRDRILIVGTPHGDNPVVWRVRDWEEKNVKKGKQSVYSIHWKEILDENDKSRWPERFTDGVIAGLKMNPEMWDTQYMLRRRRSGIAIFDMGVIRDNFYRWEARGKLIGYNHREWNIEQLDDGGYPTFTSEFRTISVGSLRTFLHCDPKHRDRTTDRKQPSQAALLVAGVAPDGHVFALETWVGDCGLEQFAEKVFWYYRKWRPWRVTMEAIGAQTWFWDYARLLEKGKYRQIMSLPRNGEVDALPKLTRRLLEAEKKSERKEEWIISQLESWFNFRTLHLHESQENLLSQCESFPDPLGYLDLLDCLSQGPPVWPKGYKSAQELMDRLKVENLHALTNPVDDITGYVRPWDNLPVM